MFCEALKVTEIRHDNDMLVRVMMEKLWDFDVPFVAQ